MDRSEYATETVYHRQLDIFDPDRHAASVAIVGAGAIGSSTALALAKMGVGPLTIYDGDLVEARNQPGQLYGLEDVGKPKVGALSRILYEIADVRLVAHFREWKPGEIPRAKVIVSAVDTMSVRRALFEAVRYHPGTALFADGRIGGSIAKVLFAAPGNAASLRAYEETLHSDEDAAELPCTARSVFDVNLIVAGLLAQGIRDFLTSGTVPKAAIWDGTNGVLLR